MFLDLSVMLCAVLIILVIIVKTVTANKIVSLQQQFAALEQERHRVLNSLGVAQKRRATAVGTGNF